VTTLEELFVPRLAVVVPEAVGRGLAGEVRARLQRTGYAPYRLLDRGRYDVLADPAEPELLAAIARIGAEVTGRTLAVAEARAIRLGPGDYLLAHHDRVDGDRPVEVMLDLSSASVPGAEVHYRDRGRVYFRHPSVPGSASVVERGPTTSCNHTYVSKQHAGAAIVRLVVLLR
jgi:hypothetical protein